MTQNSQKRKYVKPLTETYLLKCHSQLMQSSPLLVDPTPSPDQWSRELDEFYLDAL